MWFLFEGLEFISEPGTWLFLLGFFTVFQFLPANVRIIKRTLKLATAASFSVLSNSLLTSPCHSILYSLEKRKVPLMKQRDDDDDDDEDDDQSTAG